MSKNQTSTPPPLPADLVKKLLCAADRLMNETWELARSIHLRPELGFEEKLTAAALADFLAGHGFRVERGVAGLATAFVARPAKRTRRPLVAFLAELDALPGLGHACGHHLIAASSAAAAVTLAEGWPEAPGAVMVIGCPAEEGGGGKLILGQAGSFDQLDAAFIAHPDQRTEVYKRSLGVVQIGFTFKGRAAHAAAFPEQGLNALDAAVQTYLAASALRQQLPDKVRIHGIISEGGVAPNIIPERAQARFYARGLTVKETLAVADRLVACARGAARGAGVGLKVKLELETLYPPYIPSRTLGEIYAWALETIGVPLEQGPDDQGMGSTDVGAVCMKVPVIHPLIAVPGVAEGVHTRAFQIASGAAPGRAMLEAAIKANALAAAAFLKNPSLQRRAAAEFKAMIKTMA